MIKKTISLAFIVYQLFTIAHSQTMNQNIRGIVVDKITQQPIEGVVVNIPNTNPPVATTTNVRGSFELKNIPIGTVTLNISFLGYKNVILTDLLLTSGKELQLYIEMEEDVIHMEEITVKATKPKSRPINEMATVSARAFTVEETERYAGSRGDIARMASNYAGVYFANDQRNDIIIRGNSPSGLLWKLEDVEIPNPNHYAENGTTGGPVSMLNNNLLRNSDFYTGAFPAEFGNALSGVFDLKMRNGNTKKHEFTIQSGFNGFEVGMEGPINRTMQSSYMAYYRYSVLDIMDKLGYSFGTAGIPRYQDLTFKINCPTKKGNFSVFGIAGKSSIDMLSSKLSEEDLYLSEGQDIYYRASMAASGISYTYYPNQKTYIKFILSGLYQNGGSDVDTLDENNKNPFRVLIHNIDEYRTSLTLITATKYSSKFNVKYGFQIDQMGYSLKSKAYSYDSLKLIPYLNQSKKLNEGPRLLKGYYEIGYKIYEKWEFKPGINIMFLTFNNSYSIEPRIGIAFNYANNRTISLGYGMHSRALPLSTYFYGEYYKDYGYAETNKNLDFIKSHHFVLGHDWQLMESFRIKTETYYQYIFNVPITSNPSSYSFLNSGASWGLDAKDSLVNNGIGYNYGIEITIEKFLKNNYYFLFTTSLFNSKYKGSDGIIRNTAFNGNYVINCLGGYSFAVRNKWIFGTDIKISTAGGKRYTPLNLEESIKKNQSIYYKDKAFECQYPPFFKVDFKIFARLNKPKRSQEWQFYIENLTNHQNPLYEYYNSSKKKITKATQLGLFPMVLWRLTF